MKAIAFGEILWDVIEGHPHLGGAPFNFTAHTAQCGNHSYIISRLGKDEFGKKAFDRCSDYQVNRELIQWDEHHPTGIVNVTLQNGQPDYVIEENAAYDFIDYQPSAKSVLDSGVDVFYFGSLAQRNQKSSETLYAILSNHRFREVFYDVNLRKKGYTESIIRKSLTYCTVLKLNVDEVPVLSNYFWKRNLEIGEFCRELCSLHSKINTVIITAADKGCMVFQNSVLKTVSGVPVKVADAVGAGDAFSAAFMHRYMKDGDAEAAAHVANHMGAFVASQHGPIPAYSIELKQKLGLS